MIKKLFLMLLFMYQSSLLLCDPNDLDTTLNSVGYTTFSISGSTQTKANAATVQSDGKIIVVGYAVISGVTTPFIARCNVDGSFDEDFGTSGYTTFSPSTVSGKTYGLFARVALQVDSKIVVVGYIGTSSSAGGQYIIFRYNTDGNIDTSFNGTGYFTSLFGQTVSESYELYIQPNSQILVVGFAGPSSSNAQILVARHNSDGTLDTSFGSSNGYVFLSSSIVPYGTTGFYGTFLVKLQSTGKIIIGASATISPSTQPQMTIVRLLTNGTVDSTFGTSGVTTTNIGYNSVPNDMAIYPSDQILVAGYSNPSNTNANQFFVARYTQDGALDTTFNSIGYLTTQPTGWSAARAWGVFYQSNGQIVVTGQATINSVNNFAAMRLNNDGSFNDSITSNGLFTDDFGYGVTISSNTVVQSNQKLIVTAGTTTNLGFVARYIGGVLPTYALTDIEKYGYNSSLISNFLYNNSYATIITDSSARLGTIAAIDAIIAAYSLAYSNQPSFNFVYYLYLLQEEFISAQSDLLRTYPESTAEINQYFVYLFDRIALLSA